MDFNLKKALLLVALLTSLSSSSFAMNRGEKRIFKQLNMIVTNVTESVDRSCSARGIYYSSEQAYDNYHSYFDEHAEALGDVHNGENIDNIAAGIYNYSDLDDSFNKSAIINEISEVLSSFKQKSFKSKVARVISGLNKTVMAGAAVFFVWGSYARFFQGDEMGSDYASKAGLTLAGSLVLNKLLSFMR